MTLQESIETIESLDFQANYSVLSGFSTVLAAFAIDETLKKLVQLLVENPENQVAFLKHLEAILQVNDSEHLHPHDLSFAAYLYILEQISAPNILNQWVKTIQSIDDFWWARKMAEKISNEKLQKLPN
jgi:hypothetical protein